MSKNRLFPRRKPEFIEPGIPKPGFFEFPIERDFSLHSHGEYANGR